MKIYFDIEATPQELRTFFGLPDVEPLQQEMLDALRRNMAAGMEGFDPVALMKPWLPPHLQSMEAPQKLFSQSFQQMTANTGPTRRGNNYRPAVGLDGDAPVLTAPKGGPYTLDRTQG